MITLVKVCSGLLSGKPFCLVMVERQVESRQCSCHNAGKIVFSYISQNVP